jgi:heparan-alpha-glucosaminide N-acetyltransferase
MCEIKMDNQNMNSQKLIIGRIESIDIIRGLTILVMIFVNDLAGVVDVPAWMKHAPTMNDGMTFVDLVFPAFLFVVGMSMPFSIGRRIENGEDMRSVWKHILIRVGGLLILGVYMVNGDRLSGQGILNPHLWILLMYQFAIIVWNRNSNPKYFLSKRWVKYSAVVGLVILLFLFKGEEQTGFIQMRTSWWGILGLIGWGYLGACLIYIPQKKNQFGLLGSIILLYCFYMAVEVGMLNCLPFIKSFMEVSYTLGSHTAIILSGAIVANKLRENLENTGHTNILKWSFGFSIFLLLTGLFLHQMNKLDKMFIISKNLGTVPWCLLSSTFTIWIWMAIYWLVDMKGFGSLFKIIEPAGTNPLFAYILAPFVVECFALIALAVNGFDIYSWFGQSFYVGFLRAVFIAFSMTWLTGYLTKKGLQLKL